MIPLKDEQMQIIEHYVNKEKFDVTKMVSYLEKHKVVKNDIFSKCKKNRKWSVVEENWCLKEGYGFEPIGVESFIKRIPFYFYEADKEKQWRGSLSTYVRRKDAEFESLEELYQGLEFLFYEQGLSLYEIFNYPLDQINTPSEKTGIAAFSESITRHHLIVSSIDAEVIMKRWIHYLKLCNELKWNDKKPKRFITRYNEALECLGLEPVIYYADRYYNEWFFREDNAYLCYGHFPCDEKGEPIMKWIGIKVKNAKKISFEADKSREGLLIIELTPATSIHAICQYIPRENEEDVFADIEENEDEEYWLQIYEGPLNMQFNHKALKEIRINKGMTQAELASAIGASVRTYQKWEGGETTPDGHHLLRIMNWLNITDVQELIIYSDYTEKNVSGR